MGLLHKHGLTRRTELHASGRSLMRLINQRYLIVAGATLTVAAASVVYSAVWSCKGNKAAVEPTRILITGAAGQIAYALTPLIASGQMLGLNQPVILHLYDVPAALDLLKGLQLELEDAYSAYPLLHGVIATTDFATACRGVSVAVLCGGVPRRSPTMSKVQLMSANCLIYREQAAALAQHAAPGVKVVVVGSPANTNAWLLQQYAPSIPPQDITALTRLDHNRALQHLAAVLGARVADISNVIVWGNHASSQFPYGHLARLRGQPILDLHHHHHHHHQQQQHHHHQQQRQHDQEKVEQDEQKPQHQHQQQHVMGGPELEDYLRNEFITIVQNRGGNIHKLRHQLSPALSAAAAICSHVQDWLLGTQGGLAGPDWVSMGVASDGSYGIAAGLVYSFPVRCSRGSWAIVKGLPIEVWAWERMKLSEADLLEEQRLALQVLAAAAAAASAAAVAGTPSSSSSSVGAGSTVPPPAGSSTAGAVSAAAVAATAAAAGSLSPPGGEVSSATSAQTEPAVAAAATGEPEPEVLLGLSPAALAGATAATASVALVSAPQQQLQEEVEHPAGRPEGSIASSDAEAGGDVSAAAAGPA